MSSLLRYDTPSWLMAFSTGKGCGVEDLGLRTEDLALPRQTHSDHVGFVEEAGRPEDTDAVITSVAGLCLCVKTADCVPILLWDDRKRIVAAIHSGWRGTVARIVQKTIEKMNAAASDLHAVVGPSIGMEAFEVGDEVYQAFKDNGFPMERVAVQKGKWHINLWEANRWLLQEMGVNDIHVTGICTYSQCDKYYSARREGIGTGRNMNGIIIQI